MFCLYVYMWIQYNRIVDNEIKVKYFDNVSGYLVYPSASAIAINSSTTAAGKQ